MSNPLHCTSTTELPDTNIQTEEVSSTTSSTIQTDNLINDSIELTDEVEECMKMAKTCYDLAECGLNVSGEYELPIIHGLYGEMPIRVLCNFTTNSTTIRPGYLDEIRLQNCDGGPGCASVNISYGVDIGQVISIVEHSTYCEQEVVFSCDLTPLVYNGVSFASWRYRNGQNQAITQDSAECKCSNLKPD